MPLPVTEQKPTLHPAALSSYENAERDDEYCLMLPYVVGFSLKLMLTQIRTTLIQTRAVLNFLSEMMNFFEIFFN